MVTDPVSDLIIRIKNAQMVGHKNVSMPYSMMKHAVADALVTRGYITSAAKKGKKERRILELELSYGKDGTPAITDVKRVSKPGRRMYGKVHDLHPVKHGRGALIVSTPKGVMSDDAARKARVGGELLFEVW